MNTSEAFVALNLINEISTIRLHSLLKFFNNPRNILKASVEQLTATGAVSQSLAYKISTFNEECLREELSLIEKYSLKVITLEDDNYPKNLRQIPDPPSVLYIKGNLLESDSNAIAIVGSRRASMYGINCSLKFSSELAAKGITVISGMARGIDTYAHKGALNNKGRTIAVMGSGFANIYPEENEQLLNEISSSGAVISEYPIQTTPLKQNFPRRNRIISGLSLGVLVVEASRNSGALITADCALEQGREVFAIPGNISNKNSFGTNKLISEGAKLVFSTEDILDEFDFIPKEQAEKRPLKKTVNKTGHVFYNEELICGLLEEGILSIDELIEKTEMDIPGLCSALFNLETKKILKQAPGKKFILN